MKDATKGKPERAAQAGQVTIEQLLLIAGIVVPLVILIWAVLDVLGSYYSSVSGLVSLPFP